MTLKIEVTQQAQVQVRELIRSQQPGTAVRVYLQAGGGGGCGGGGCGSGGGGCGCGSGGSGGVSFGMSFDKARNGDEVLQVDGFSVVVDPSTASELEGAKIDFVQSLDQSGFQIIPPNRPETATPTEGAGGCGCGSGGCC
ncbi:MAG TPA: iron-sulfur cluster biosynthesis family protein [Thermoplasmata archaeon]